MRVGGGIIIASDLSDAVMIKDNHIKAAGGIRQPSSCARSGIPHTMKIEVETESLEQAKEALDAGADIIMLDNMPPDRMEEAVKSSKSPLAAIVDRSIGRRYLAGDPPDRARRGVDVISVGGLTHSVMSLDISLDLNAKKGRQACMILVMDVGQHEYRAWRIQRTRHCCTIGASARTGPLRRMNTALRSAICSNMLSLDIADVDGVILSSVVPPLNAILEAMCAQYLRKEPLVVGPGLKTGLNIRYENPQEVGADRIVNAVAAIEQYGRRSFSSTSEQLLHMIISMSMANISAVRSLQVSASRLKPCIKERPSCPALN